MGTIFTVTIMTIINSTLTKKWDAIIKSLPVSVDDTFQDLSRYLRLERVPKSMHIYLRYNVVYKTDTKRLTMTMKYNNSNSVP